MMNQQPRVWAESLLVAYVDGQLDAAQAQAVEAALRDDAEARAIVGVLRASGSAVKQAYDEALERPLPAGLRDLFADVPPGATTPSAEIVAFRPRRTAMQRLLPLAASIAALLIGFGAGYVSFGNRAGFTPAGEEPRGELYLAALQRAAPDLRLEESVDAVFDLPERELFVRAGRVELFEAARAVPAVLLTRWTRV